MSNSQPNGTKPPPAEDSPPSAAPANAGPQPTRAPRGRVLILEDDELLQVMAAEVLKRIHLEVTTVADGSDALRHFYAARDAGRPFDLVILDLVIPDGKGGKETLRQLRALDSETKIVVSSGYKDLPHAANYAEHGFDRSLPKPYSAQDLLQLAAELLPEKPVPAAGKK